MLKKTACGNKVFMFERLKPFTILPREESWIDTTHARITEKMINKINKSLVKCQQQIIAIEKMNAKKSVNTIISDAPLRSPISPKKINATAGLSRINPTASPISSNRKFL